MMIDEGLRQLVQCFFLAAQQAVVAMVSVGPIGREEDARQFNFHMRPLDQPNDVQRSSLSLRAAALVCSMQSISIGLVHRAVTGLFGCRRERSASACVNRTDRINRNRLCIRRGPWKCCRSLLNNLIAHLVVTDLAGADRNRSLNG